MMRLLLVRHGETALNAERRFQGQVDPPLNERGRRQAAAAADLLADCTLDGIYSSDLLRARETAEIIGRHQRHAIITSPLLRELSFGTWEGLTYREIVQLDRDHVERWTRDRANVAPPGGETVGQLHARLAQFLVEVRSRHASQTLLLVAHGGVIQLLVATALGLPPAAYWQFRIDPGSLSEISLQDEGAILGRLNVVAPAARGVEGA